MKTIMTGEANWKPGKAAGQPRSEFDYSILLWCGMIGLAVVAMLAILMLMSGPPVFPEGAVPP